MSAKAARKKRRRRPAAAAGLPDEIRTDLVRQIRTELADRKHAIDRERAYFGSAEDDRTIKNRWTNAADVNINQLMQGEYKTSVQRARYEYHRNGYAKGIVKTFAKDIVGKVGPTLQIVSDDPDFNAAGEDLFKEYRKKENYDIGARLSLTAELKLDIKMMMITGGGFTQRVTDKNARFPVQTKSQNIHPDRVDTPIGSAGHDNIFHGIEVDRKTGRVSKYHVRDPDGSLLAAITSKEVAAEDMLHLYVPDESEQIRSMPWMESVLDVFSQLRAFTRDTLLAARIATMFGVLLHADNPDAEFQEESFITDLEPASQMTLPPGYQASQVKPEHPSTQYEAFIKSKLREAGRPVLMPYLKVASDAAGHNYSSGRLDLQDYNSFCEEVRGLFEEDKLERIVTDVVREGSLTEAIPPQPVKLTKTPLGPVAVPAWHAIWTWPPQPHVDPEKEARAASIRIESGTSTRTQEANARNRDYADMVAQRKREQDIETEAGVSLPEPGGMIERSEGLTRED